MSVFSLKKSDRRLERQRTRQSASEVSLREDQELLRDDSLPDTLGRQRTMPAIDCGME